MQDQETTDAPSPEDRLLVDPKGASRILTVSPRKLWQMKESGEIPHVRIGRLVRYPVADLRAWIDAHKEGGQP